MKALLIIFTLLSILNISLCQINVFTASFSRWNSLQDGAGPTLGTLNYDGVAGGIKVTYDPNSAIEWYRFTRPPLPTLVTTLTSAIVNTPTVNQTWNTLYSFPYSTTAPSGTPCDPATATTCTIGTVITAVSAGTAPTSASITYSFSRGDVCTNGCSISSAFINIPPCVTPSAVTVTPASCLLSAGSSTAPDCVTPGIASYLKISTVGTCSSVTVTMPGAYINPGPLTIQGGSACTSGPTNVFTCQPYGTGLVKYKNANTGCPCEVAEVGDYVFWPLASTDLTTYYNALTTDPTVTSGGKACTKYLVKSTVTSNVTTLWAIPSPYTLCQFTLNSGEIYTLTSFTASSGAQLSWQTVSPQPCSYCNKPIDTIFIGELSTSTLFSDVLAYQNFISTIARNYQVTPPTSNFGIISYSPNGVTVDLPLSSGVTQPGVQAGVKAAFVCCNTQSGSTDGPCCSSGSVSLVSAINAAAAQLAGSTRAYASRNIVLLTKGAFTDTTAAVLTALKNAQTTVGRIINFYTVVISRDNTVINKLNSIAAGNAALSWPLVNSTLQQKVVNRVYPRGVASTVVSDLEPIVSGICGGNGDSSCGKCCGDCTCGTICVAPTACKPATCFNVSLTPLPISSSTCCNYKQVFCPVPTSQCQTTYCNFTTGNCDIVNKPCPPSNQCFNYQCNPSTGNCDEVPKFTVTDLCNIPSCNRTSNTIIYTKKVCPSLPCSTVSCENTTGNCTYTPLPQILPTPCHIANCSNNKWVYTLNCPVPSDPCKNATCITTGSSGLCSTGDKCTIDLCNTCNAGSCVPVSCPSFFTNGTYVDKCRTLSGCSLASGCSYITQGCSPGTCQNASCNSTTGLCDFVDLCPRFQPVNSTTQNPCRAISSCSGTAPNYNCVYAPSSCVITSSSSSNIGKCGTTQVCPAFFTNGTSVDKCRKLRTCDWGNCTYNNPIPCGGSNSCLNYFCNPSSGSCTNQAWAQCPYFEGGTNRCRVRSTCNFLSQNCTYTDLTCSGTPCETWTCNNATGCVRLTGCPTHDNSTGTLNRCRPYSSCNATGVCLFGTTPCVAGCTGTVCNVTTGLCDKANYCPAFENTTGTLNQCRPVDQCYGTNNCTYKDRDCGVAPTCKYFVCTPPSGLCTRKDMCTPFETINGVENKCRLLDKCFGINNCTYKNQTTCGGSGCSATVCNTTTGGCDPFPFNCPPNPGGDKCQTLSNCFGVGNCSYSPVVCGGTGCAKTVCNTTTGGCDPFPFNCPPNPPGDKCQNLTNCYGPNNCSYTAIQCATPPPCQTSSCDITTGKCVVSNKTNWDPVANCPVINCLTAIIDYTKSNCCGYKNLCSPSADLCLNVTCLNGSCVTLNRTCPDTQPGNKCTVSTGCSQNTCTYTNSTCPTSPDPCQDNVCNPNTGICGLVPNYGPGCVNYCIGKVCPDKNCKQEQCNPATGACEPTDLLSVSCYPPNTCITPECNTTTSTCTAVAFDVASCPLIYGAAPTCQYWGLNPYRPGCCQLLPRCNQQIDPRYLCMLLYCDNTTNDQCLLKDNSAALCSPYLNNDKCRPFVSCDNSTGACTYADLSLDCEANKRFACQISSCDAATGQCIYTNTSACQKLDNPCYDVKCPIDACKQYLCNSTNGECYVKSTTTCNPPNTCATASCDSTLGCQYTAIDVQTQCGPVPDPCVVWTQNFTKVGCCDTKPLCPTSTDACSPIVCDRNTSTCVNQTYIDICPPYDNTTGTVNYCRKLSGCIAGSCIYSDVICEQDVPCLNPTCNPTTGACEYTDNCPTNPCISKKCDTVSKTCVTVKSLNCFIDYCSNTSCDPLKGGCVTYSTLTPDTCPTPSDSCLVNIVNPTNVQCCETRPKCTNNNPCVNVTCSSGNCNYTSVCPTSTCNTVSCSSPQGVAVCSQTPIPCAPQNPCFTVDPCVEGQPFKCTQKPVDCVVSSDKCFNYFCDPNNATSPCQKTAVVCDDNNPCTSNLCDPVTGNCYYPDQCKPPNPCMEASCNLTTGCVYSPVVCDDREACTTDACVNGTCVFTPINCNDNDSCTVDYCKSNIGCFNDKIDCFNATTANDTTFCGYYVCNSTVGCVKVVKECNSIAIGDNTISVAVVAGTSAGIIAAIVVGIVAVIGCASGGGYAMAQNAGFAANTPVFNNPIYQDPGKGGDNILYRPSGTE